MDWIRENKIYVIAGITAVLFFLYSSFDKEDELTEMNEGTVAMVADVETNSDEKDESNVEEKIMVMMADIKGAVENPGVYEIYEGGRVVDLIELAGGLAKDADTAAINFALYVQDEMAIYVPRIGEDVNAVLPVQVGETAENGTVNLNSAGSSELQTLPGIGPAKAEAIIEYRESNGPYKSIEDLKEISGIGDKTFEKLKDLISVK
ncbi:helix-hairpin-helix domain-containing protein [Mesobacillus selenatarsenatis]|uniref:Late competence protein ComEA, DNA receptor n=1 Tax=Mesobacillus selenatarsenatis (strain DSM 18680 / JCM 14380 / FERM P-15431 / SF-1) TaxID=1321606 RepID=A0A0A8X2S8_MESS1|nr:helix-hairpin-helix domain-containing protein [Mesobacillus selenatarsenatis]GAM13332.1 Late competence protein ComEA, DNA receptor [Mesobacillus selenatarsenatis SF-1]